MADQAAARMGRPQEYGAKTKGRRKPAFLLLSFIAALRGRALFIFPSG
ncbi:hypothetical protein [Bradyrhizobium retamae]|nr:hypothetical protein [Bradyrhizobium retamae]